VPDSYLASEVKTGLLQPAQVKVPVRCSCGRSCFLHQFFFCVVLSLFFEARSCVGVKRAIGSVNNNRQRKGAI
jgi:hypothetical protein